jgi:hypothetical protein
MASLPIIVSYNWPIPSKRIEKDEDLMRWQVPQNFKPFIATPIMIRMIAATYTKETKFMDKPQCRHHADHCLLYRRKY